MLNSCDYAQRYKRQYEKASFETVLIKIRRKQVLKSLKKYCHGKILEVGCGLEPLCLYFDDYETYTIVEPSKDFVKHAERCVPDGDSITIVHGALEEVSEELSRKKSFDFIILSSLLHEVPNPTKLLCSVFDLCNESTTVHINVPNVYSFHRLLALEMGLIDNIFEKSQAEIKFQRHTRFDKESFLKMIKENGFEVLSFGTYFVKPFSNKQMKQIIEEKIVDESVIEGLDKMTKYLPDMGCEMYVEVRKNRRWQGKA